VPLPDVLPWPSRPLRPFLGGSGGGFVPDKITPQFSPLILPHGLLPPDESRLELEVFAIYEISLTDSCSPAFSLGFVFGLRGTREMRGDRFFPVSVAFPSEALIPAALVLPPRVRLVLRPGRLETPLRRFFFIRASLSSWVPFA